MKYKNVLKQKIFSILITTYVIFNCVQSIDKCSKDGPLNPEYYLVKKCHRSKLNVLAKGNYPKLSNCKRFALEKKGLSFNFSPQAREGRLEDTCEVLQCAEISTGLLRNNDSRYDYYSLFGNLSCELKKSVSTVTSTTDLFIFD